MVSIRTVAERAGVSATTVSRIFNGDKGFKVKEETRNRVWEAINDLGYNPAARQTKTLPKKAASDLGYHIGTILNITIEGMCDPSFLNILRGIEDELKNIDQTLDYFRVARDQDLTATIDRIPDRLDGFIAMHGMSDDDLSRLRKRADHIVAVDAHLVDIDTVGYDHFEVGALAANHLLDQGYRSFGYIYGTDNTHLHERKLIAFQHRIESSGGVMLPEHIVEIPSWQQSLCYQATIDILSSPKPPRALCIASDILANTALDAIKSLNLSVPNDVAVMGISNNGISLNSRPSLTTIDLSLTDMGKIATKLLVSRIKGDLSPVKMVCLPVRVIKRDST